LHKAIEIHEDFDDKLIASLYDEPGVFLLRIFKFDPSPHQYFILKSNKASVLAHYDPYRKVINRVEKYKVFGIEPRNAEQTFSIDALIRPEVQLISLTGKAGTGKTLLALAAALHQDGRYKQILLARPIMPLANRDMGFLPGDVSEKIGPYMQPLYDNLTVIKHNSSRRARNWKRLKRWSGLKGL
jgi:PhoH-like ATPase